MFQIHLREAPGDIMVFLPGQDDIESLQAMLERKAKLLPKKALGLKVCPLFAALPPSQQLAAFAPAPTGTRRNTTESNTQSWGWQLGALPVGFGVGVGGVRCVSRWRELASEFGCGG